MSVLNQKDSSNDFPFFKRSFAYLNNAVSNNTIFTLFFFAKSFKLSIPRSFIAILTKCDGFGSAFFHKIPVAHIEAGLRTHDKHQPFPEEVNRRLATQIADLHFAPTEQAKQNLLKESIDPATISVTGNTVIDAMQWVLHENASEPRQDVLNIQHWHQEHIGEKQMVLIS